MALMRRSSWTWCPSEVDLIVSGSLPTLAQVMLEAVSILDTEDHEGIVGVEGGRQSAVPTARHSRWAETGWATG